MFAPWGKVVLDIYRNENTWESSDSVSEFREYAWIYQSLILSELYIMIFFFLIIVLACKNNQNEGVLGYLGESKSCW